MSWGALPWWFYLLELEHYDAMMSGCMKEEWHPRYSRSIPPSILASFYK